MVLRQCFETLRENQAQGTSKVNFIPTFSITIKQIFHKIDGAIS
jgi:hypothetical protein